MPALSVRRLPHTLFIITIVLAAGIALWRWMTPAIRYPGATTGSLCHPLSPRWVFSGDAAGV
jgi:hypothetical protein